MQIISYINYFLLVLLVLKVILFFVLITRRPKIWNTYSFREKLKMTLPFGLGRKSIRSEDWQSLKWNQILTESIVYLLLLRVAISLALLWAIQSEWIKQIHVEKF